MNPYFCLDAYIKKINTNNTFNPEDIIYRKEGENTNINNVNNVNNLQKRNITHLSKQKFTKLIEFYLFLSQKIDLLKTSPTDVKYKNSFFIYKLINPLLCSQELTINNTNNNYNDNDNDTKSIKKLITNSLAKIKDTTLYEFHKNHGEEKCDFKNFKLYLFDCIYPIKLDNGNTRQIVTIDQFDENMLIDSLRQESDTVYIIYSEVIDF